MCTKCQKCGNEYKNISRHFHSCGYPTLSDNQKEIIIGCLMGDANIDNRDGKRNRTARFTLTNTNPDYAKFVFKQLPVNTNINEITVDGYKNQYKVKLTHPYCNELAQWYKNGKKEFPNDINLTPTVLKHWYCCDGHKDIRNRFTIAVENEKHSVEKLKSYFTNVGLEISYSGGQLYTTEDNNEKIFKYIGTSIPGFDYKWP